MPQTGAQRFLQTLFGGLGKSLSDAPRQIQQEQTAELNRKLSTINTIADLETLRMRREQATLQRQQFEAGLDTEKANRNFLASRLLGEQELGGSLVPSAGLGGFTPAPEAAQEFAGVPSETLADELKAVRAQNKELGKQAGTSRQNREKREAFMRVGKILGLDEGDAVALGVSGLLDDVIPSPGSGANKGGLSENNIRVLIDSIEDDLRSEQTELEKRLAGIQIRRGIAVGKGMTEEEFDASVQADKDRLAEIKSGDARKMKIIERLREVRSISRAGSLRDLTDEELDALLKDAE